MKLTMLLLTAAFLQVHASAVSQSVTLSGKNMSLKRIFAAVEKQTGYVVFSNKQDLEATKPVTLAVENMPLTEFLRVSLKDQPVNYRFDGTTIVLSRKPAAPPPGFSRPDATLAPPQPVTGKVVDSLGRPVEGASVKLSGADKGTFTNANGSFILTNVSPGSYTLEVSFVGYQVIKRTITVYAGSVLNIGTIVLKQSATALEDVEIVTTGYQNISRERVTGSYSTVSQEQLRTRMETNLLNRIEGLVPGLFITNGEVNIRGLATLYGDRSPLYVVDGFPYESDINFLNPDDVINVTVLKDAAATSIYGTRAANGVISITTRLGSARQSRINFSSTLFSTAIPDASYYNFMNSREMVDLQQDLFNKRHPDYNDAILREAQPKAIEALYKFEQGLISKAELDATLNKLRGLDGQSQIEDLLMRTNLRHRENFSATGGNNINQYSLTMNYTGNRGYTVKTKNEIVNIGLTDKAQVFKWLTADAGVFTNIASNKSSSISPLDYYYNMPYEVIKDENGKNVPWNYRKSKYETDRLIGLGLLDESFNPLDDMDRTEFKNSGNTIRLQGGFNAKISKALNFDLKYQTERGNYYSKQFYGKDSYYSTNMINDATTIVNGSVIKNIPDGGQIIEQRQDSRSYTARAQLNFDKNFRGDHQVTALAGAERRDIHSISTSLHRMGYNDNNLEFFPVDEVLVSDLKGTQAVSGVFNYRYKDDNFFSDKEDRYVSFYGNAGYSFRQKYNVTGSIRVDDSNLFGTDPKYRHLPVWSVGASWRIGQESFMKDISWLDNLTVRVTQGLGGNVARTVGPFLQASSFYFNETKAVSTSILFPPNKSLRWEKTATTNLGIDFALLKNRLSGSFDFYNRKTTDLLGEKKTDPTNAFNTALINYGSLTNKGYELGIKSVNVVTRKFRWSTQLVFSYNKNKMTNIASGSETIYTYVDGFGANKIGYPVNSLFNFRSAGLDPTNGTPMVYDSKGNVIKNYDQSGSIVANMTDPGALVYGGSMQPSYTMGLTNTFTYKGLALNIMLIANGGNVMRDALPSILTTSNFSRNQDKRVLNYWKQPGDENKPGIMPAPDLANTGGTYLAYIWYSTDRNTLKADYFKVRDISLSYEFAPLLKGVKRLSSAKLVLQAQNAISWYRNDSKLDPESYSVNSIGANRLIPVTATYMVGIDVTF